MGRDAELARRFGALAVCAVEAAPTAGQAWLGGNRTPQRDLAVAFDDDTRARGVDGMPRRRRSGRGGRATLRRAHPGAGARTARPSRCRARLHAGLLSGLPILLAAAAWAATSAAQPGPDLVAVEAMRCWRRIATHAVHVGERFDMVLTCAVVDTDTARVVPDPAWLEPETLGVSPFEVLDGERYDDVVRGPRRFFQYRYALRIIGEDYFGLDVELPPLELRYRIERSLDGSTATEGRELAYVLPPESVRVLSLVPAAAVDIRELPGETFGDVEARLFRANLTGIAAAAVGVMAAGVLLLGAIRARREWRGSAAVREDRVPGWRVARTALGELRAVRDATEAEGWTADLVARALSALRVAAALAVGRPVAQRVAGGGATDPEGRLAVRRGLFGTDRVFVSSSLTARDVDLDLPRIRAESPEGAGQLESLRAGLACFGATRYGAAAPAMPGDSLTVGLEAGIVALQALQVELFEPVRRASRLYRSCRQWAANRWRP